MRLEPTPWAAWLRAAFAFGVLPEAFWRLSVREWRALAAREAAAFDRASFETLAAQFPDKSA